MNLKKADSINALLIGTNGTGKTTVLRKILEKSARTRRVLVVPSNPNEPTFNDIRPIELSEVGSFKGVKRVRVYNEKEFCEVARNIKNCVLITDDFRNYLPRTTLPEDVRRMFINRRHIKLDIYMAAHGFTQVPPEFFNWLNMIFVFRTTDNPARHRDKFADFDRFVELCRAVNKEARENDQYHYKAVEFGGL